MTSFYIAPFHLYDEEHGGSVQRHNSNIWGVSVMRIVNYLFKMDEFCCHWALFLWQPQHFMNMGCLSYTVAMATFTTFFLKITAHLIDKIRYYASRMNEASLTDTKKLWFLTLFKCIVVSLLQNVVRSLLSAGGTNYISHGSYKSHLLLNLLSFIWFYSKLKKKKKWGPCD